MHTLRLWAALPLLAGLYLITSFLLTGCNKASSSPQPQANGAVPGNVPVGQETASPGKKLFDASCARCHSLGGSAGAGGPPMAGAAPPGGPVGPAGPGGRGGRTRGPDLAKVGASHNRQWIADHIRNPKQHKANSNMPSFGPDKISDADLLALSDYLANLK